MIIDGTWHQAKTIVRDVPQLRDMPCYRLRPLLRDSIGFDVNPMPRVSRRWKPPLRRCRCSEPDTVGLDQLLSAFHQMVEKAAASTRPVDAVWRQVSETASPASLIFPTRCCRTRAGWSSPMVNRLRDGQGTARPLRRR